MGPFPGCERGCILNLHIYADTARVVAQENLLEHQAIAKRLAKDGRSTSSSGRSTWRGRIAR
jgi:hypothetical protein